MEENEGEKNELTILWEAHVHLACVFGITSFDRDFISNLQVPKSSLKVITFNRILRMYNQQSSSEETFHNYGSRVITKKNLLLASSHRHRRIRIGEARSSTMINRAESE